MSQATDVTVAPEAATGDQRLAILLAMAMFVLVVDTSIMNVSISAVVKELDTTVSCDPVGDRARGAGLRRVHPDRQQGRRSLRAQARLHRWVCWRTPSAPWRWPSAQSVTAIFIFWAVIGGLGASLLLPAMQSLIHGNFEGDAQKATYALVGAAAAIAAAVGPLIGGFITTFLSYRVGVPARGRRHRDRPVGSSARQVTCRTPVRASVDLVGAVLSVLGMGGLVLGILVWQEGAEAVGLLLAVGVDLARCASRTGSSAGSARASRP